MIVTCDNGDDGYNEDEGDKQMMAITLRTVTMEMKVIS